MSRQLLFVAVCSVMITLAGCGGEGDQNGGETSENGDTTETEESTDGQSASFTSVDEAGENWAELSGTVTLKGEKPAPQVQTDSLEACKMHEGSDGKLKVPIAEIGENDGIKNVFVWVEPTDGGMKVLKSELPSKKETIDQKGCLFHPDSAIVAAGGELTVKNSDAGSHNFNYKGDFWGDNISQEQGATDTITDVPEEPQFVTFNCDIHPWMKGTFRVAKNHTFALTAKDGSFNLGQVAPGEYKVKVHHKRLNEPVEKGTVTVTEDGSVEGLDLSGLQLEIEG